MQFLKPSLLALALVAGFSGGAHATFACRGIEPTANTSISAMGSGSYHYAVTATGFIVPPIDNTPCLGSHDPLTDFYLPYFADMGISGVSTSGGWSYAIESSNDKFQIGGGVIHFYTSAPDQITATFNFNASYDGVKGPFASTMRNAYSGGLWTYFGDPLIPGSPDTINVLGGNAPGTVPEPASLALVAAALALSSLVARRVGRR